MRHLSVFENSGIVGILSEHDHERAHIAGHPLSEEDEAQPRCPRSRRILAISSDA